MAVLTVDSRLGGFPASPRVSFESAVSPYSYQCSYPYLYRLGLLTASLAEPP
jgi:hypothetical protein